MQLPFSCEKSGAIALVQWQAGWLADKIVLNLEIFKIIYWMKYSTFAMFNKGTVLL